jgi:aldose 1-epimerase
MSAFPVSLLELRAGELRLALRPDLGGCIAGLWRAGLPVLRSVEPAELRRVDDSASFPLVPYSNRLAERRFDWLGRHCTTAPNFPGRHSLHGVAWQRAWAVESSDRDEAQLAYVHTPDEHWPFAFEARQRIALSPDQLECELRLTNTADGPAPAGLGWHPYFPKRTHSRLQAEVTERWEPDPTLLPTHRVAQAGIDSEVAHLNFDHGFEGWRGGARIRDEQLSIELESSLDRLVVYTPPHDPFFAVEPVSHTTNAINMAGPARHGLRTLQPGESFTAWMRLRIAPV